MKSLRQLVKDVLELEYQLDAVNYQARNFLRAMKRGDLAIYYHSNAEPPAAVPEREQLEALTMDDIQDAVRTTGLPLPAASERPGIEGEAGTGSVC